MLKLKNWCFFRQWYDFWKQYKMETPLTQIKKERKKERKKETENCFSVIFLSHATIIIIISIFLMGQGRHVLKKKSFILKSL